MEAAVVVMVLLGSPSLRCWVLVVGQPVNLMEGHQAQMDDEAGKRTE